MDQFITYCVFMILCVEMKVILHSGFVVVDNEACSDLRLGRNYDYDINDEFHDTSDNELQGGDDGTTSGSSVEMISQFHRIGKVPRSSSGVQFTAPDGNEPYVGQEFESEHAANAFYSAYGLRLGFMTRIHYNTRSKLDGAVISRTIVCNKEGYRKVPRHEVQNRRVRTSTRVGCKALLSVRKMHPERWVVAKFVKEHNHELAGQHLALTTACYSNIPIEDVRVQELTQELMIERSRIASYKRCIEVLFSQIEEHTDELSKKIRCILESVHKIESEGGANDNPGLS